MSGHTRSDPSSDPTLTFIIGATGCGKGSLGRALARRTGGEIISADSMKVYRRMDIGTAKPSAADRRDVPHHVIDVVDPWETFSVAGFVARADAAIADIHGRHRPVFVVGGTPLYIKALSEGLFEDPGADPAVRARLHDEAGRSGRGALHRRLMDVDPIAAERIHPNDLRRTVRALEVFEITGRPISELQTQWNHRRRYGCVMFGVRRAREDQHRRTNDRVRRMMGAGLLEEVRSLLALPQPLSRTARSALGYAELIEHLEAGVPLADAIEKIKINTRRLVKAQRTWLRRFTDTQWIDLLPDSDPERIAEELVKSRAALWSV
ncbi:MAG: tRNA (adenosine(37)-N6)-dimethylallyltransferase MiaA [Phycisphaerae bacterium]